MVTFDFKCKCGIVLIDKLVKKHDEIVLCECGKKMKKCISAPNIGGMDNLGRSK